LGCVEVGATFSSQIFLKRNWKLFSRFLIPSVLIPNIEPKAFLSSQDMSGYGSLDGSGPAQNKTVIIGLMAATGVVLLFTIIGTALPQGKVSVQGFGAPVEGTVNAWKSCTGDSCSTDDFACGEAKSRWLAVRAFSIITILALFGAIAALGAQMMGKLPKLVPAAILAFAWFTWLLSWAIVAGTLHAALCGQPAAFMAFGEYGPGFGLSVAAWVFLTIEVGAAVFFAVKQ
jgi:hypothetical protein